MKNHLLYILLTIYLLTICYAGSLAQGDTNSHPSLPAFTIKERDAHLECISYDSVTQSFYLGSIHKRKIIRVDANNKATDFTSDKENQMFSLMGLATDSRHNSLWACCTALPEMQGYTASDMAQVLILKFNLKTGALIKTYKPNDNENHVLGEPLVASNGDVYISDSGTPNIYRIGQSDTLELFMKTNAKSLQGIAFNENESTLFYADYSSGLYRCLLKNKETAKLKIPDSLNCKGTDGLYFYNSTLIAIQNGLKPAMISQFKLNREQDEILSGRILDKDNPAFNEPTTGTIVKDNFFYIANSQWSGYDKNHQILPVEQLQDIKILKLALARD